LPQEAGEAAEMIVVTVAQDQRIDGGGIDPQETHIVDESLGCEPKVDQHRADLASALRFDVHGEAEFADDRLLRWLAAERPTKALDLDVCDAGTGSHRDLIAVDHRSDRDPVHLGHGSSDSLGQSRLGLSDQRRNKSGQHGGASAAQHIAAVQAVTRMATLLMAETLILVRH
jgi:hypothetical protein